MKEELVPYLVEGLGLILTAIFAVVARSITRYADAKFDATKYQGAKDTVTDWIGRAVDYFDQTVVEQLKKDAADSKIDADELARLKARVKEDALRAVKTNAAQAIEKLKERDGAAAVEAYLEHALESYINQKRGQ